MCDKDRIQRVVSYLEWSSSDGEKEVGYEREHEDEVVECSCETRSS